MNRILLISLLFTLMLLCIAIVFASHYKRINEQQNNRIQNLTANVNLLIDGRKKDYADYRTYLLDYTKDENWWERQPMTLQEWLSVGFE